MPHTVGIRHFRPHSRELATAHKILPSTHSDSLFRNNRLQGRRNEMADIEKNGDISRDRSLEDSQTSTAELNSGSPVAKSELDTLNRIESATSAVYDPASRVPTNASRESGIIGIDRQIVTELII